MSRYAQRRRRNAISLGLCYAAAAFGLGFLCLILALLVDKGLQGFSLDLFTEMTPPPGSNGGLLNAIYGSLVMTLLGVVIGTPLGMLAGTYMAEYGRGTKLTFAVRFINDILLSAPSIVIGLFVYEILVSNNQLYAILYGGEDWVLNRLWDLGLIAQPQMHHQRGHFSGFAGALALAIIVVPVVVRTTEDMLLLVPTQMREAATALGMPRVYVITKIAYKAASAGLLTGVLLAIARASGETAPLLFTALNSPFFSTNLDAPMASLPIIIFQFAMSPYADWQQLAWSGALIITAAVLALSIFARLLASYRVSA